MSREDIIDQMRNVWELDNGPVNEHWEEYAKFLESKLANTIDDLNDLWH